MPVLWKPLWVRAAAVHAALIRAVQELTVCLSANCSTLDLLFLLLV